jgi:uncharacterized protein (TIGR02246 family)
VNLQRQPTYGTTSGDNTFTKILTAFLERIEKMKSVLLAVAFVALFAFAPFTNAQAKSEEQAVRKVVADFAEAINRGDAKAFAALFAEDADFVVITGKYLKGRNEIVAYHAELFTGGFQGSYLEVTSVAIRFLRPDVAVARVTTIGLTLNNAMISTKKEGGPIAGCSPAISLAILGYHQSYR